MDTTETTQSTNTDEVIGRFLAFVEAGVRPESGIPSDDVVLDATVPNWRFTVRGADAVGAELGGRSPASLLAGIAEAGRG